MEQHDGAAVAGLLGGQDDAGAVDEMVGHTAFYHQGHGRRPSRPFPPWSSNDPGSCRSSSTSGPSGAGRAASSARCSSARPPLSARASSSWSRSTSTPIQALARTYRSRAFPRSRRSGTARWSPSSSGPSPLPAVERFMDALVPSPAEALIAAGRRGFAAPGGRARADPRRRRGSAGADRVRPRRRRRGARAARTARGSFQADGLAARIALERAGSRTGLADAFAAHDAGDHERALDLLLEALPSADGARDDIRRVIVGILDELGVEHPLAREGRRRLAAALY